MPHRQQLCLEWNQSLSPYLTTSILLRRVGHSYTPKALSLKFHQLKKKKPVSKTTVIVRNLTEGDKVSCYSLDFFIHFLKFFICWQFIWTYLGFLVLHTKNNYFQSCEGRTELQDVPLTRCLAGENEFYCAHCKLPEVFITYSPALFAEKRREHYILCKDLRRSHLSGG